MYFSPLMPFTPVKPGAKITGAYLGEESEMAIRNKKYLEETRRDTVSSVSVEDASTAKSKYHVKLSGIVEKPKEVAPASIDADDSRQFEQIPFNVNQPPADE